MHCQSLSKYGLQKTSLTLPKPSQWRFWTLLGVKKIKLLWLPSVTSLVFNLKTRLVTLVALFEALDIQTYVYIFRVGRYFHKVRNFLCVRLVPSGPSWKESDVVDGGTVSRLFTSVVCRTGGRSKNLGVSVFPNSCRFLDSNYFLQFEL